MNRNKLVTIFTIFFILSGSLIADDDDEDDAQANPSLITVVFFRVSSITQNICHGILYGAYQFTTLCALTIPYECMSGNYIDIDPDRSNLLEDVSQAVTNEAICYFVLGPLLNPLFNTLAQHVDSYLGLQDLTPQSIDEIVGIDGFSNIFMPLALYYHALEGGGGLVNDLSLVVPQCMVFGFANYIRPHRSLYRLACSECLTLPSERRRNGFAFIISARITVVLLIGAQRYILTRYCRKGRST